MLPVVTDQIANLFTVHRLWEINDRDAWLAENGSRIRGVAAGGHSPVNEALLSKLPSAEIVAAFGVGYDQIDAKWAGKNGIVVTNTPDVLTDEVADLTIGLLISTVRRIPAAERHLREGKWPSGHLPAHSVACATARSEFWVWGGSARPSRSAWKPSACRSRIMAGTGRRGSNTPMSPIRSNWRPSRCADFRRSRRQGD